MTEAELQPRLTALRGAARKLRGAETAAKNQALLQAADLLASPPRQAEILAANQEDVAQARKSGSNGTFLDRLLLDPRRLAQMVDSLRQVAALSDPVGEVVEARTLKNELKISRVRAPLGVILMIFESRPNVATEAFSLAFKAGNVTILRGGKESMRTTALLYTLIQEALRAAGLPADCLWGITDPDRNLTEQLLKQDRAIDVVVPRGGAGLIEFVAKNTRIPIIKNDRGLCHIYVHEDADLEMATDLVINSKCQRPGVCNSLETLLVHKNVSATFLTRLHDLMTAGSSRNPVRWHGCPTTVEILKGRTQVGLALPVDWDTEYLDFEMNCRIVESYEEALEHIEAHGSRHSEAIVTADPERALQFESEVDAAAVYWNASTRFTDGYELGLGGELGISTQKLHVRGPVGLRELTCPRWIIEGHGQIRT